MSATSPSGCTARISTILAERRPRRFAAAIADVAGVDDATVATPSSSRPSRSRSTSTRPPQVGLKAGDIRRAATSLLSGHPGRQPVRGAEGLRGRGLGRPPSIAQSLNSVQDLLIETPDGGPRPTRRCRRRARRADPERHRRARASCATSTSRADVGGRDLGAVARRCPRGASPRSPFDVEYHAEVRSAALERSGRPACACSRCSPAARSSSCSCSRRPSVPGGSRSSSSLALPAGRDRRRRGDARDRRPVHVRRARRLHRSSSPSRSATRRAHRPLPARSRRHADRRASSSPSPASRSGSSRSSRPCSGLPSSRCRSSSWATSPGSRSCGPMAIFVLGGLVSVDPADPVHRPEHLSLSGPSPESETESLLERTAGLRADGRHRSIEMKRHRWLIVAVASLALAARGVQGSPRSAPEGRGDHDRGDRPPA